MRCAFLHMLGDTFSSVAVVAGGLVIALTGGVWLDPELSGLNHDHLIAEVRKQSQEPVSRVTKPLRATIGHDDRPIKAICEMVSYGVSLLPVIRDRRVVGVIRSVEVFEALTAITD